MKLILINDQGVQREVWDTKFLEMDTAEEIGERILAALKLMKTTKKTLPE